MILALGWSWLIALRRGGWKIEGAMRRGIKFVEGKAPSLEEVGTSGTPSGLASPRPIELDEKTILTRTHSTADSGFGVDGETSLEVHVDGQ